MANNLHHIHRICIFAHTPNECNQRDIQLNFIVSISYTFLGRTSQDPTKGKPITLVAHYVLCTSFMYHISLILKTIYDNESDISQASFPSPIRLAQSLTFSGVS